VVFACARKLEITGTREPINLETRVVSSVQPRIEHFPLGVVRRCRLIISLNHTVHTVLRYQCIAGHLREYEERSVGSVKI
jgi:hypothetical protein